MPCPDEQALLEFTTRSSAGAGFEVDTNRVVIVGREGCTTEVPLASKRAVAESILDAVEARLVR